MDNETCIKIADQISDKLIKLCINNETNNKSIIELYNELLDDKYEEYKTEILSHIAERLSLKGYVIENGNNFMLRKY